jgi:hypothetical protein
MAAGVQARVAAVVDRLEEWMASPGRLDAPNRQAASLCERPVLRSVSPVVASRRRP